jgi:hypothetical protein
MAMTERPMGVEPSCAEIDALEHNRICIEGELWHNKKAPSDNDLIIIDGQHMYYARQLLKIVGENIAKRYEYPRRAKVRLIFEEIE